MAVLVRPAPEGYRECPASSISQVFVYVAHVTAHILDSSCARRLLSCGSVYACLVFHAVSELSRAFAREKGIRSHAPTGFHLMILFRSAVSCSSVHGSVTTSYSDSCFGALSIEEGVCSDCATVSTCGVDEAARDDSRGRFFGGIVICVDWRFEEKLSESLRIVGSKNRYTESISVAELPFDCLTRLRQALGTNAGPCTSAVREHASPVMVPMAVKDIARSRLQDEARC